MLFPPPAVKPHAPTNVRAVTQSNGVLRVTWEPPSLPAEGLQCQLRHYSPSAVKAQPEWKVGWCIALVTNHRPSKIWPISINYQMYWHGLNGSVGYEPIRACMRAYCPRFNWTHSEIKTIRFDETNRWIKQTLTQQVKYSTFPSHQKQALNKMSCLQTQRPVQVPRMELAASDMCRLYVVQARCMHFNGKGYWSEWSDTVYSTPQNSRGKVPRHYFSPREYKLQLTSKDPTCSCLMFPSTSLPIVWFLKRKPYATHRTNVSSTIKTCWCKS